MKKKCSCSIVICSYGTIFFGSDVCRHQGFPSSSASISRISEIENQNEFLRLRTCSSSIIIIQLSDIADKPKRLFVCRRPTEPFPFPLLSRCSFLNIVFSFTGIRARKDPLYVALFQFRFCAFVVPYLLDLIIICVWLIIRQNRLVILRLLPARPSVFFHIAFFKS